MNWFRRLWYNLLKRNGLGISGIINFTALENLWEELKEEHYHIQAGVCIYINTVVHALLSSVVTEIKLCPQFARLWETPNSVTKDCVKWRLPVWMFLLSATGKMAIPFKKCEGINTLTLHLFYIFLYQDRLYPSRSEPILLVKSG